MRLQTDDGLPIYICIQMRYNQHKQFVEERYEIGHISDQARIQPV